MEVRVLDIKEFHHRPLQDPVYESDVSGNRDYGKVHQSQKRPEHEAHDDLLSSMVEKVDPGEGHGIGREYQGGHAECLLGLCHLTHFEEQDTYKVRSEEPHELRVCGRHTVRQAVGTGAKVLVEVWTRLFDDFLDDFVDNFADEVPSDDYDGFDFSRKKEP